MSSIVPFESYVSMPWKNGLGVTAQIAIHPPGSTITDFKWRISSAEVRGSNPFSIFAGYRRILVLVSANADCIITHPGTVTPTSSLALVPFAPYQFSGSIATHCTVTPRGDTAPLIKDFNVIFNVEFDSDLRVHCLSSNDAPLLLSPPPSSSFYLLFCASGSFVLNQSEHLSHFASLCCHSPSSLSSFSVIGSGVLFEVWISDKRASAGN